jgi:hypothetical protein
MASTINSPLAGEIWHLSIEDLFTPVQETLRLGGDGPFVINLSVSTAPIDIPKAPLQGCDSAHIYRIQVTEDGRTRYRLRLGPFTTEDEADAVLAAVRETYPGALTATAGALDLRSISSLQEKRDFAQSTSRKPAQKTAAGVTVDLVPASLPREASMPPVLLVPEVQNMPPAPAVPPELSTAWALTIEAAPVAKSPVLIKAQTPITRPPSVNKLAADFVDFEIANPSAPAAGAIPILLDVESAAPELKAPPSKAAAANNPDPDVIDFEMPMSSAPAASSIPVLDLEVAATPAPGAPVAAKPGPVIVQPVAPIAPKSPVISNATPLALSPPAAPPPKPPVIVKAADAKPVKPAAPHPPAATKPAVVLTQSVASKPSFFAPKAAKGNVKNPGATLTSLQHVATAIVPAAREVKKLPSPLPELESTQTVRALTAPELENEDTSRWFVIQLSLSDQAFDPDTVPNLDIFSEYRLYSVAGMDQGRLVHALRLGFFSEEVGAVAVASYLGAYYDKPTIRRVSVAERERFSHQRVEARKDVGASGTHAVIEITSDLIARRKRTTSITDAPMPFGAPQGTSPTSTPSRG